MTSNTLPWVQSPHQMARAKAIKVFFLIFYFLLKKSEWIYTCTYINGSILLSHMVYICWDKTPDQTVLPFSHSFLFMNWWAWLHNDSCIINKSTQQISTKKKWITWHCNVSFPIFKYVDCWDLKLHQSCNRVWGHLQLSALVSW